MKTQPHAPTEPHLAVRQALALAILRSRAAITDIELIRSAERLAGQATTERARP